MRLTLTIAGRRALDLVITAGTPTPGAGPADDEDDQDPTPFGYAVTADHELSYQDPDIHHSE